GAELRDQHVPGWRFQLAQFANVAADEQHAAVAATIETWFAAWNTTDAAARARLVAACCRDDVTMQDRYSCLAGTTDLLDHLVMCQRFQPGLTICAAGAVRQCQGTAVVDWRTTDQGGAERGRGCNVFRLAADGRIAGVVGLWS
ncbi:MAG: nuclear transport factor 2 family protein, partial [Planctomycetes bacterium]|nr:nuclear transport factor 2 family protein [Planctomycetota bacterium]